MNAPRGSLAEETLGQIARRNLGDLTQASDALARVIQLIAPGV